MRLTCPECKAQYEVEDRMIPAAGRDVQCSNCNHRWYQGAPEPDGDPQGSPAAAPETDINEEFVRRPIDPQVLSILREEAERETAARREEAGNRAVETPVAVIDGEPDEPDDDSPEAPKVTPEPPANGTRRSGFGTGAWLAILAQTTTTSESSDTAAQTALTPGQPRHGGVLKRVGTLFPKILGYPEEFTPIDSDYAAPALERLVSWDAAGNLIPVLAESWEGDPEKKTITWHLRKGVLFTDGTPFDAKALKWNWESRLRAGRMIDGDAVKSLEVIDDHTLRMHLNDYHRLMLHNYGWSVMVSPTAFEKAGDGDLEKSKSWARANAVGTGPFRIVEFKRDVLIRYEKNENYWQKNLPYYDGMESRLIPDPMIASAMMQAREADFFTNVDVRTALDLEGMGFKVNWGPGLLMALLPNSSDPDSPYADRRVREAVEYAIDRPAVAKMIGHGKYEPITQLAGKAFPGYVPDYDPRPYNVAKAKQLLAEAGYPDGFRTEIIANDVNRDLATALKSYLGEVGIIVDLDIAETARFTAAVFADGWSDLVLAASGINPDATDLFVHYGPDPMTYRTGNIAKSDEYLALCDEALHTYDDAGHYNVLKRMVRQAGEDAMVVPIFITSMPTVMQSYVHSDYPMIHIVVWDVFNDWMEEH